MSLCNHGANEEVMGDELLKRRISNIEQGIPNSEGNPEDR